MPQVPYNPGAFATPATVRTPQVPGAGAEDYLRVSVNPEQFGAQQAEATRALGAAVQDGGAGIVQGMQPLQEQHDAVLASQGETELRTQLAAASVKFRSLTGNDAVNALPAFMQQMKQIQDGIAQTLPNPMARSRFAEAGSFHLGLVAQGATDYAAEQSRIGAIQASNAAGEAATNDAVTYAGNPTLFAGNLNEVRVHAQNAERFLSPDEGVIAQAGQAAYDKGARSAIMAVAASNPDQAQALLESIRTQMSPVAYAAVGQELKPALLKADGDRIFNQVVGEAPAVLPASATLPQLAGPLTRAESGGAQFNPDGSVVTSPKGAIGKWQVMPATAQQYGYSPAQLANPVQNDLIGRSILASLMTKYGDPNLALAAYNAGPAAVDGWLKQYGDPRTGDISDAEWVSRIPIDETRNYVSTIAGDYAASNGLVPQGPLDPDTMRQKALAATRGLDPEEQDYILGRVERHIDEVQAAGAVHARAVRQLVEDAATALISGQDTPIPEGQIRTSLPPDEADAAMYELTIAKNAGSFIRSTRWSAPGDVAAGLQALSTQGAGPETPDEFVFHQRVIGEVQRAVAERTKALLADPASYAAANPDVQALLSKVDPQNPQTFQAYANATLALQGRLGVPPGQQHVLSRATAADIVANLTKDPNADMGSELDRLSKVYGNSYPQAFGDLVRLGKLPGSFMVLGSMDAPAQFVARQDLQHAIFAARAAGGLDKLMEPFQPTDRNAIKGGTNDLTLAHALAPFARTVSYNGAGGQELLATVRSAVQTLAANYVQTQGMSGREAISKAVNGILDEKYVFEGTQRIPRANVSDVEAAEAATLQGLTTDNLVQVTGAVPQEQQIRQRDVLRAARSGFWVNNPDDTGARLMMNTLAGPYPVFMRDGSPVEVRFDQAAAIAAQGTAAARARAAGGLVGLTHTGTSPLDDLIRKRFPLAVREMGRDFMALPFVGDWWRQLEQKEMVTAGRAVGQAAAANLARAEKLRQQGGPAAVLGPEEEPK